MFPTSTFSLGFGKVSNRKLQLLTQCQLQIRLFVTQISNGIEAKFAGFHFLE